MQVGERPVDLRVEALDSDVVVDRIVVRAVDTSGNASAPSNEILFDC